MKNTIFFNVDTQRDFINPGGALYIKDAELIKTQLQFLTQLAEENKIKVINTADFHNERSKEISATPDFINTFPKHCMCDSEGCNFIEETNPKKFYKDNYYIVRYTDDKIDEEQFRRARNIIVLKDEFDVFKSNKLIEETLMLIQKDVVVENIVVYGVATDICVAFVIDGLLKRRFKVSLVFDAVKGLPGRPLDDLYAKWIDQGVFFTTTKKLNEENNRHP